MAFVISDRWWSNTLRESRKTTHAILSRYIEPPATEPRSLIQEGSRTKFVSLASILRRRTRFLIMSQRLTMEKGIYWTIQVAIMICVTFMTGIFLKTSLHAEEGHQTATARNDSTHAQEQGNQSCRYPLVPSPNRSCMPPCDWSFMSSFEWEIYDHVMSYCLKIALVAMVITLITWLACKPMRRFPHIVRFYILVNSVSFTMAGIIPTMVNTDTHSDCVGGNYWTAEGLVSNAITLQGAACHYFLLTLCFWLLCYVINTYLLLVLDNHQPFIHPTRLHVIQLLFCFVLPFILVGICLLVDQQGYNMLFKDRLAILPSSHILLFATITIPVQLSSGASLFMLVAIIRRIRKISRNPQTAAHVIRSDEQTASLKKVERHFFVLVFIYVLSMVLVFIAEAFLQDQEITYMHNIQEYFACLQTTGNCTQPSKPTFFLSSLKILTPGVFCVISFFLLFFTNETRAVWTEWFRIIRSQMSKLSKFFSPSGKCQIFPIRRQEPIHNAESGQATVIALSCESVISLKVTCDAQEVSVCETKDSKFSEE